MRAIVLSFVVLWSGALRPDVALSDLAVESTNTVLKSAAGLLGSILAENGNSTEHLSQNDLTLLREVINMIESMMFGELDSASEEDQAALNAAVEAGHRLNSGMDARQSETGDIGLVRTALIGKQSELNRFHDEVQVAETNNESTGSAFDLFAQSVAASCGDVTQEHATCPVSNGGESELDAFFERSMYMQWYTARQSEYEVLKADRNDAEDVLRSALADYNAGLASRNAHFCDYKVVLEGECSELDSAFQLALEAYDDLVPTINSRVSSRRDTYRAGVRLVLQANVLLGEATAEEEPQFNASRFNLNFPSFPEKTECELVSPDDPQWVPTPECGPPPKFGASNFIERCPHDTANGWHYVLDYSDDRETVDIPTSTTVLRDGFDNKNAYYIGNAKLSGLDIATAELCMLSSKILLDDGKCQWSCREIKDDNWAVPTCVTCSSDNLTPTKKIIAAMSGQSNAHFIAKNIGLSGSFPFQGGPFQGALSHVFWNCPGLPDAKNWGYINTWSEGTWHVNGYGITFRKTHGWPIGKEIGWHGSNFCGYEDLIDVDTFQARVKLN